VAFKSYKMMLVVSVEDIYILAQAQIVLQNLREECGFNNISKNVRGDVTIVKKILDTPRSVDWEKNVCKYNQRF